MRQTAKIEIDIPDKCDWTVADVEKALKKVGIKVEITAVFCDLKIPKLD